MDAEPPPLPSSEPPPLPVIRLNCFQCQQSIEVNADAVGQSFFCPNCGSKVDVGNFEDYQSPAVISETEPIGNQTSPWPRQDNPVITIGIIAAVVIVGVLLLTLSINAVNRNSTKAVADKQSTAEAAKAAEAEHQRKVNAVAKRIADAQAKRDAARTAETSDPELTADQKHEARVAAIRFTVAKLKRDSDRILGTLNTSGEPFTPAERQAQREFAYERFCQSSPSLTAADRQIVREEISKWWR
jgi:hypothetical protein